MNMLLWITNLVLWSAQAALLALAGAFLPRLFQIRQAPVLLVYWRALLAISLLLPFVEPWRRAQVIATIGFVPDAGGGLVPPAAATALHWHLPSLAIVAQVLGAVILAGGAARFVILALGLLKLHQFRRTSSAFPAGAEPVAVLEQIRAQVDTPAEFRLSADVDSPVTFGFRKPVILFPERFPSMDARFQAAIACHELLHARRHDWAHQLAEEIVRGALWFHPAIAWLIARVRLAREQVVDHEVVRFTKAPKPYVEALLEFTDGRTAAVPAPPFLVERQLAERVALMLKEVRMSRARLISSLLVMACWLLLAAILAVWTFPLKAAPRPAQAPSQNGVAAGVSGGVAEDSVDKSTIWTDTVKKGTMALRVRGLGVLVPADSSGKLIARVTLPEDMAKDVKVGESASIDTHNGVIPGHVIGRNSEIVSGMRSVDIAPDSSLTAGGAHADEKVDSAVELGLLENVVYVGRPVGGKANSDGSLFKVINNGKEAERVEVKFGRASVNTIEILNGLQVGDTVILSDMSHYDKVDRVPLK